MRPMKSNRGMLYAVGAYASWGLLPVYWKWLQDVPAPELLSHRVVWSCISLVIVIVVSRQWRRYRSEAFRPSVLRRFAMAAILIGINWLTYVWAVNSGHIIETSLGYFINPLLSVLLGVVVLRERLRPLQWLPVALAATGVAYLTISYGELPWIALVLAFTFAFYGLIKKTAPLGSLFGLTLETALLLPLALAYLAYVQSTTDSALEGASVATILLLVGAGVMTTIPLLLFASAASRIPLSLIGVLQYIAPTLQFLIGALVYDEPLTTSRLIGFSIVWLALLIFAVEGYRAHRAHAQAAGVPV